MSYSCTQLPLAIGFPFIVSLLLLAVGRWLPDFLGKILAYAGFLLPAVIGIVAWIRFGEHVNPETGYAYLVTLPFGLKSLGIAMTLGLNGISMPLFVLAGIVGAAAGFQAINNGPDENKPLYFGLLLFILSGLLGVFASVDVFFFYFFHEFALIPTFILILCWGGLGRRTAAIQMAVYLTLGAMISLAGIIMLYIKTGSQSFDLIALKQAVATAPLDACSQSMIFGLLLFGFGILVSLFPFHSWAPPAYTEAPTPVSMLHAGVLKKFGLYGLIQLGAMLLPLGLERWAPLLLWLALGNIVIIGLVTMSQRHLKEMISYSSVMHMGPCFLGIVAYSAYVGGGSAGIGAAVMMMFAHGLSVALLFVLCQGVYKRAGTFEFGEIGGLTKNAPVLAGFFIAATMASIGLPGFANFWGELGIFVSLGNLPPWQLALAVSSIVISAIYGLRAVANVFFGSQSEPLKNHLATHPARDITISERLASIILLAALVAVGFYPKLITDPLDKVLKQDFSTTAPAALPPDCQDKPSAPPAAETTLASNSTHR
ncbi:MAG: NADH-quinone oxidoreductase subunit M [Puniceicoccales bacterium]|jgi:NADH-quinone oxidoreductase subunit M|nr:NADH-quinone oxidoreductase subunit M [Puniceicoccales bacterium]